MIKNCFPLVVLCVLFSCTSNPSQDAEHRVLTHEDTLPLSPPSDEKPAPKLSSVEEIQKAYMAVTADYEKGKLDSISFKYNCDGERSGTVTYFSKNGDLKMVTHVYAEYDHNEMKDSYFVNNGVPFFAHLWSLSWSFDQGPEGATKDKITEHRTYLSNWKPIKCLEKKYEVRLHAGVNPNPTDVPNKEVDCSSLKAVEKSYRLIAKYWKAPAPKCLTD